MRYNRHAPAPFYLQQAGTAPPWLQTGPHAGMIGPLAGSESWHRVSFAMVWLLTFLIPWGDMVVLPYDVQASRVFTLVAVIAWILHLKSGYPVRELQSSHRLLALFVLWALASVLWTEEPERAARRALSYCQLFLDLWLVYQCASTARGYRRLLGAFLLGCVLAFTGLAYNLAIGEFQGDGRYTAPGFDPNDLAGTLILGIPTALYLSASGRRAGWISWLYVPCAVLASLLTASRGALAALAVCLLGSLVITTRISIRAVMSVILLATLSATTLGMFWNEISIRRLSTISEEVAARDLNGRVDIWERGFNAFLERPVAGVGGGGFGSAVGARSRELAAHNAGLGVLVEHGLVGFTLFAGGVLQLLLKSWRRRSLEEKIWMVTLAGWAIAATTLSWENREITWLLWGFCSAAAALREPARQRWPRPGGLHA